MKLLLFTVLGLSKPLYLESPQRSDSITGRLHLVQFTGFDYMEDVAELESRGILFLRYIPQDAFIVLGDVRILERPGINVYPYTATQKISPNIDQTSDEEITVRITAFRPRVFESVIGRIMTLDYELVDVGERTIVSRLPARMVWHLAELDEVEWIAPTFHYEQMSFRLPKSLIPSAPSQPMTKMSAAESGLQVVGFPKVWDKGYRGHGQLITFADSGLDNGDISNIHEEFRGQIEAGRGHGFLTPDWKDPLGHGTHVAGLIAMQGRTSQGRLLGGAHEARLIAQGLYSDVIDNLYVPSNIEVLFRSAYEKGSRIHSNSWGAANEFGVYDDYARQVDEFIWNHPEFIILFAAGNAGTDKDRDGVIDKGSISSPGTAKNCITVGASENFVNRSGLQRTAGVVSPDNWRTPPLRDDKFSDDINGLAVFSSRGPTKDLRIKPDIVAPGTNILSIRSTVAPIDSLWGAFSPNHVFSGGTSVATPIVASAAALAREAIQKELNRTPSAALVKSLLLFTSQSMFPGQFGYGETQEISSMGPGVEQGFGRLDVEKAVDLSAVQLIDNREGVGHQQRQTYEIYMPRAGKLRVLLMYSDYPASPAASQALVSDLDMELKLENGSVRAARDPKNNWELIEEFVPAGRHQLHVFGYRVPLPQGQKQPFAIVHSKRH